MLWQQKGQLTEEPIFFFLSYDCIRDFPSGSVIKNPSAMQEMQQEPRVQSLGQEDPLEKEMATHSSILA